MMHSFAVTFGAKYLTDMATSVPPYETFSLIICLEKQIIILNCNKTIVHIVGCVFLDSPWVDI
jgi:hypothetical protein